MFRNPLMDIPGLNEHALVYPHNGPGLPGYADPQAVGVMKYLTMVAPAAPSRRIDLGTDNTGLNLSPGNGSVGTLYKDLNLWPYIYKRILIRLTGTCSSTSLVGARGTIVPADEQYGIVENLQLFLNGADTFQTWDGRSLHMFGIKQGAYRNNEQPGLDVPIAASPYAANPVNFDITLVVDFGEKDVYPRLFGLMNAYNNHGTTSFQLRIDFGSIAHFVTGDANAVLTMNAPQFAADVLDFTVLNGYGEPYVRETTFPRFETRELRSNPVAAGGVSQRIQLPRGLFYHWIMLREEDTPGNGYTPLPGNVTKIDVVRNNTDHYQINLRMPHLDRMNADWAHYNGFTGTRDYIHFINLAPEGEVSQMINTLGMNDWDLLVDTTAAGNLRLTMGLYNIPAGSIQRKKPHQTIGKAGMNY